MGYPESVVTALSENNLLSHDKYPNMDDIAFKFALSKDHWQEEVDLLKKWNDDVKKYLPDVCKDLVG